MLPSTPSGAVFDNTFETAAGAMEAGTSFALALEGLPAALVTCQHLFGPAGGLSKDVPTGFMSRFVSSVSVQDALGHAIHARAGAAVLIPDADASEPGRDLAAFPLEANAALRPFRAGAAATGGRVYLAARLRKGAPTGTWLFAAEHLGTDDDGTALIQFDDPEIYLPGTSGAPVLNEEGELVGMVVRFSKSNDNTFGTLLDAQTVEVMLRKAEWPAPKKAGFLSGLFK
jgi:hypothetical protein